jgi:phosphatidylinositol glycan class O
MATILSYVLIAVYWGAESSIPALALLLQGMAKGHIPRMIYAIGLGQLLLFAVAHLFDKDRELDYKRSLVVKTVSILSAWSPTIIILSGKQGSLVALALIIGGAYFLNILLVLHQIASC